jgi:hypothetical protein
MINEQFNKLIPYVSENFITYPLFEEGNYAPFLNFWTIPKEDNVDIYKSLLEFQHPHYEIIVEDTEWSIKECSIYPKFTEPYQYTKPDWSIEEMVEIVVKLLKL